MSDIEFEVLPSDEVLIRTQGIGWRPTILVELDPKREKIKVTVVGTPAPYVSGLLELVGDLLSSAEVELTEEEAESA